MADLPVAPARPAGVKLIVVSLSFRHRRQG